MSVQRRVKMGSVFALAAAALLMVLLAVPEILDAWATNGNYSFTFSVPVNGSDEVWNGIKVPVSVYKVADLDDAGQKMTAVEAFKDLDLNKVNQGTASADDMRTLAGQAAEIVKEKKPDPTAKAEIEKAKGDQEQKREHVKQ